MKTKIIALLFLLPNIILASYMAEIKPYEKQQIKSEVSGKIIFLDKSKEFSIINTKSKVLVVDSFDEKLALENLKKRLVIQKEIFDIRKKNYENKSKVKQISLYDKSLEKVNYLTLEENILNIKKDIKNNENIIKKKVFYVKNSYIGKIYKNSKEYVQVGENIFDLYDFSKLKIELYLKEDELKNLDKKTIYIDNEKSDFYVWKVSKIKDLKRVSKYKVILLKENKNLSKKVLGQIVNVEIKDENSI